MLHLPGNDKMRVASCSTGTKHVEMDRVMIAATPSYNLIRKSDGVKIGWIEKKLISLMDTFDVYMEGKGGFGVTGLFKPDPAYRIEGDFLDRNFSFKNEAGKVVARANMDGEYCCFNDGCSITKCSASSNYKSFACFGFVCASTKVGSNLT